MLFDNPIFKGWYTDTVDIYRVVPDKEGNLTKQKRQKQHTAPIPCRVYSSKRDGPIMGVTAAKERSMEKMACDLSVDIMAGDELRIVRGGNLGHANQAERYFAGEPQRYYDPVGGALTGLEHQKVGLLKDEIVR